MKKQIESYSGSGSDGKGGKRISSTDYGEMCSKDAENNVEDAQILAEPDSLTTLREKADLKADGKPLQGFQNVHACSLSIMSSHASPDCMKEKPVHLAFAVNNNKNNKTEKEKNFDKNLIVKKSTEEELLLPKNSSGQDYPVVTSLNVLPVVNPREYFGSFHDKDAWQNECADAPLTFDNQTCVAPPSCSTDFYTPEEHWRQRVTEHAEMRSQRHLNVLELFDHLKMLTHIIHGDDQLRLSSFDTDCDASRALTDFQSYHAIIRHNLIYSTEQYYWAYLASSPLWGMSIEGESVNANYEAHFSMWIQRALELKEALLHATIGDFHKRTNMHMLEDLAPLCFYFMDAWTYAHLLRLDAQLVKSSTAVSQTIYVIPTEDKHYNADVCSSRDKEEAQSNIQNTHILIGGSTTDEVVEGDEREIHSSDDTQSSKSGECAGAGSNRRKRKKKRQHNNKKVTREYVPDEEVAAVAISTEEERQIDQRVNNMKTDINTMGISSDRLREDHVQHNHLETRNTVSTGKELTSQLAIEQGQQFFSGDEVITGPISTTKVGMVNEDFSGQDQVEKQTQSIENVAPEESNDEMLRCISEHNISGLLVRLGTIKKSIYEGPDDLNETIRCNRLKRLIMSMEGKLLQVEGMADNQSYLENIMIIMREEWKGVIEEREILALPEHDIKTDLNFAQIAASLTSNNVRRVLSPLRNRTNLKEEMQQLKEILEKHVDVAKEQFLDPVIIKNISALIAEFDVLESEWENTLKPACNLYRTYLQQDLKIDIIKEALVLFDRLYEEEPARQIRRNTPAVIKENFPTKADLLTYLDERIDRENIRTYLLLFKSDMGLQEEIFELLTKIRIEDPNQRRRMNKLYVKNSTQIRSDFIGQAKQLLQRMTAKQYEHWQCFTSNNYHFDTLFIEYLETWEHILENNHEQNYSTEDNESQLLSNIAIPIPNLICVQSIGIEHIVVYLEELVSLVLIEATIMPMIEFIEKIVSIISRDTMINNEKQGLHDLVDFLHLLKRHERQKTEGRNQEVNTKLLPFEIQYRHLDHIHTDLLALEHEWMTTNCIKRIVKSINNKRKVIADIFGTYTINCYELSEGTVNSSSGIEITDVNMVTEEEVKSDDEQTIPTADSIISEGLKLFPIEGQGGFDCRVLAPIKYRLYQVFENRSRGLDTLTPIVMLDRQMNDSERIEEFHREHPFVMYKRPNLPSNANILRIMEEIQNIRDNLMNNHSDSASIALSRLLEDLENVSEIVISTYRENNHVKRIVEEYEVLMNGFRIKIKELAEKRIHNQGNRSPTRRMRRGEVIWYTEEISWKEWWKCYLNIERVICFWNKFEKLIQGEISKNEEGQSEADENDDESSIVSKPEDRLNFSMYPQHTLTTSEMISQFKGENANDLFNQFKLVPDKLEEIIEAWIDTTIPKQFLQEVPENISVEDLWNGYWEVKPLVVLVETMRKKLQLIKKLRRDIQVLNNPLTEEDRLDYETVYNGVIMDVNIIHHQVTITIGATEINADSAEGLFNWVLEATGQGCRRVNRTYDPQGELFYRSTFIDTSSVELQLGISKEENVLSSEDHVDMGDAAEYYREDEPPINENVYAAEGNSPDNLRAVQLVQENVRGEGDARTLNSQILERLGESDMLERLQLFARDNEEVFAERLHRLHNQLDEGHYQSYQMNQRFSHGPTMIVGAFYNVPMRSEFGNEGPPQIPIQISGNVVPRAEVDNDDSSEHDSLPELISSDSSVEERINDRYTVPGAYIVTYNESGIELSIRVGEGERLNNHISAHMDNSNQEIINNQEIYANMDDQNNNQEIINEHNFILRNNLSVSHQWIRGISWCIRNESPMLPADFNYGLAESYLSMNHIVSQFRSVVNLHEELQPYRFNEIPSNLVIRIRRRIGILLSLHNIPDVDINQEDPRLRLLDELTIVIIKIIINRIIGVINQDLESTNSRLNPNAMRLLHPINVLFQNICQRTDNRRTTELQMSINRIENNIESDNIPRYMYSEEERNDTRIRRNIGVLLIQRWIDLNGAEHTLYSLGSSLSPADFVELNNLIEQTTIEEEGHDPTVNTVVRNRIFLSNFNENANQDYSSDDNSSSNAHSTNSLISRENDNGENELKEPEEEDRSATSSVHFNEQGAKEEESEEPMRPTATNNHIAVMDEESSESSFWESSSAYLQSPELSSEEESDSEGEKCFKKHMADEDSEGFQAHMEEIRREIYNEKLEAEMVAEYEEAMKKNSESRDRDSQDKHKGNDYSSSIRKERESMKTSLNSSSEDEREKSAFRDEINTSTIVNVCAVRLKGRTNKLETDQKSTSSGMVTRRRSLNNENSSLNNLNQIISTNTGVIDNNINNEESVMVLETNEGFEYSDLDDDNDEENENDTPITYTANNLGEEGKMYNKNKGVITNKGNKYKNNEQNNSHSVNQNADQQEVRKLSSASPNNLMHQQSLIEPSSGQMTSQSNSQRNIIVSDGNNNFNTNNNNGIMPGELSRFPDDSLLQNTTSTRSRVVTSLVIAESSNSGKGSGLSSIPAVVRSGSKTSHKAGNQIIMSPVRNPSTANLDSNIESSSRISSQNTSIITSKKEEIQSNNQQIKASSSLSKSRQNEQYIVILTENNIWEILVLEGKESLISSNANSNIREYILYNDRELVRKLLTEFCKRNNEILFSMARFGRIDFDRNYEALIRFLSINRDENIFRFFIQFSLGVIGFISQNNRIDLSREELSFIYEETQEEVIVSGLLGDASNNNNQTNYSENMTFNYSSNNIAREANNHMHTDRNSVMTSTGGKQNSKGLGTNPDGNRKQPADSGGNSYINLETSNNDNSRAVTSSQQHTNQQSIENPGHGTGTNTSVNKGELNRNLERILGRGIKQTRFIVDWRVFGGTMFNILEEGSDEIYYINSEESQKAAKNGEVTKKHSIYWSNDGKNLVYSQNCKIIQNDRGMVIQNSFKNAFDMQQNRSNRGLYQDNKSDIVQIQMSNDRMDLDIINNLSDIPTVVSITNIYLANDFNSDEILKAIPKEMENFIMPDILLMKARSAYGENDNMTIEEFNGKNTYGRISIELNKFGNKFTGNDTSNRVNIMSIEDECQYLKSCKPFTNKGPQIDKRRFRGVIRINLDTTDLELMEKSIELYFEWNRGKFCLVLKYLPQEMRYDTLDYHLKGINTFVYTKDGLVIQQLLHCAGIIQDKSYNMENWPKFFETNQMQYYLEILSECDFAIKGVTVSHKLASKVVCPDLNMDKDVLAIIENGENGIDESNYLSSFEIIECKERYYEIEQKEGTGYNRYGEEIDILISDYKPGNEKLLIILELRPDLIITPRVWTAESSSLNDELLPITGEEMYNKISKSSKWDRMINELCPDCKSIICGKEIYPSAHPMRYQPCKGNRCLESTKDRNRLLGSQGFYTDAEKLESVMDSLYRDSILLSMNRTVDPWRAYSNSIHNSVSRDGFYMFNSQNSDDLFSNRMEHMFWYFFNITEPSLVCGLLETDIINEYSDNYVPFRIVINEPFGTSSKIKVKSNYRKRFIDDANDKDGTNHNDDDEDDDEDDDYHGKGKNSGYDYNHPKRSNNSNNIDRTNDSNKNNSSQMNNSKAINSNNKTTNKNNRLMKETHIASEFQYLRPTIQARNTNQAENTSKNSTTQASKRPLFNQSSRINSLNSSNNSSFYGPTVIPNRDGFHNMESNQNMEQSIKQPASRQPSSILKSNVHRDDVSVQTIADKSVEESKELRVLKDKIKMLEEQQRNQSCNRQQDKEIGFKYDSPITLDNEKDFKVYDQMGREIQHNNNVDFFGNSSNYTRLELKILKEYHKGYSNVIVNTQGGDNRKIRVEWNEEAMDLIEDHLSFKADGDTLFCREVNELIGEDCKDHYDVKKSRYGGNGLFSKEKKICIKGHRTTIGLGMERIPYTGIIYFDKNVLDMEVPKEEQIYVAEFETENGVSYYINGDPKLDPTKSNAVAMCNSYRRDVSRNAMSLDKQFIFTDLERNESNRQEITMFYGEYTNIFHETDRKDCEKLCQFLLGFGQWALNQRKVFADADITQALSTIQAKLRGISGDEWLEIYESITLCPSDEPEISCFPQFEGDLVTLEQFWKISKKDSRKVAQQKLQDIILLTIIAVITGKFEENINFFRSYYLKDNKGINYIWKNLPGNQTEWSIPYFVVIVFDSETRKIYDNTSRRPEGLSNNIQWSNGSPLSRAQQIEKTTKLFELIEQTNHFIENTDLAVEFAKSCQELKRFQSWNNISDTVKEKRLSNLKSKITKKIKEAEGSSQKQWVMEINFENVFAYFRKEARKQRSKAKRNSKEITEIEDDQEWEYNDEDDEDNNGSARDYDSSEIISDNEFDIKSQCGTTNQKYYSTNVKMEPNSNSNTHYNNKQTFSQSNFEKLKKPVNKEPIPKVQTSIKGFLTPKFELETEQYEKNDTETVHYGNQRENFNISIERLSQSELELPDNRRRKDGDPLDPDKCTGTMFRSGVNLKNIKGRFFITLEEKKFRHKVFSKKNEDFQDKVSKLGFDQFKKNKPGRAISDHLTRMCVIYKEFDTLSFVEFGQVLYDGLFCEPRTKEKWITNRTHYNDAIDTNWPKEGGSQDERYPYWAKPRETKDVAYNCKIFKEWTENLIMAILIEWQQNEISPDDRYTEMSMISFKGSTLEGLNEYIQNVSAPYIGLPKEDRDWNKFNKIVSTELIRAGLANDLKMNLAITKTDPPNDLDTMMSVYKQISLMINSEQGQVEKQDMERNGKNYVKPYHSDFNRDHRHNKQNNKGSVSFLNSLHSYHQKDSDESSEEESMINESDFYKLINNTNVIETMSEQGQLFCTIINNDVQEINSNFPESAFCHVNAIKVFIRAMAMDALDNKTASDTSNRTNISKTDLTNEDRERMSKLFSKKLINNKFNKTISVNAPADKTVEQLSKVTTDLGIECICGRKYHHPTNCILVAEEAPTEPHKLSLPALVAQPESIREAFFRQCGTYGILATLSVEDQKELFDWITALRKEIDREFPGWLDKIDRIFKASLAAYIQSKKAKRLEQQQMAPTFRPVQSGGRGGYQPFRSHYQNQSGDRSYNAPPPFKVYNRSLSLGKQNNDDTELQEDDSDISFKTDVFEEMERGDTENRLAHVVMRNTDAEVQSAINLAINKFNINSRDTNVNLHSIEVIKDQNGNELSEEFTKDFDLNNNDLWFTQVSIYGATKADEIEFKKRSEEGVILVNNEKYPKQPANIFDIKAKALRRNQIKYVSLAQMDNGAFTICVSEQVAKGIGAPIIDRPKDKRVVAEGAMGGSAADLTQFCIIMLVFNKATNILTGEKQQVVVMVKAPVIKDFPPGILIGATYHKMLNIISYYRDGYFTMLSGKDMVKIETCSKEKVVEAMRIKVRERFENESGEPSEDDEITQTVAIRALHLKEPDVRCIDEYENIVALSTLLKSSTRENNTTNQGRITNKKLEEKEQEETKLEPNWQNFMNWLGRTNSEQHVTDHIKRSREIIYRPLKWFNLFGYTRIMVIILIVMAYQLDLKVVKSDLVTIQKGLSNLDNSNSMASEEEFKSRVESEPLLKKSIDLVKLVTESTIEARRFDKSNMNNLDYHVDDDPIWLKIYQIVVTEEEQETELARTEVEDFKKKHCNQLDFELLKEEKPELFPIEFWGLVPDLEKVKVKQRWSRYSPERIQELINIIMTTLSISKESEARVIQEPIFRAMALANLDVFGHPIQENPPYMKADPFRIRLKPGWVPTVASRRRWDIFKRASIYWRLKKMEEQGRIDTDSKSEWSNPTMMVAYPERIAAFNTKHEGRVQEALWEEANKSEIIDLFRMTGDYRELNMMTLLENFPLQFIPDLLDEIRASGRYSLFDLEDAFFTIPMDDEESKSYTAFQTPDCHAQYNCCPMGCKNAALHFARVVSKVFKFRKEKNMKFFVFQDDVTEHENDFYKHYWELITIFEIAREHSIIMKVKKAFINYMEIRVLGHLLSKKGRAPDPNLIKSITAIARPTDLVGVQSVCGLAQVAREYVHLLTRIIEPIQKLSKKGVDIVNNWGQEQEQSLETLKTIITSAPVLMLPDISKRFIIATDACRVGRGLGAVLLQETDSVPPEERPVAYWSRALIDAERNYSATDLEATGLHNSVIHWQKYFMNGREDNVVRTDHYALLRMICGSASAAQKQRMANLCSDLQGIYFCVEHRAGKVNIPADSISRLLNWGDRAYVYTRDMLQDDFGPLSAQEKEQFKNMFRQDAHYMIDVAEEYRGRIIEEMDKAPLKSRGKIIEKIFREKEEDLIEQAIQTNELVENIYKVHEEETRKEGEQRQLDFKNRIIHTDKIKSTEIEVGALIDFEKYETSTIKLENDNDNELLSINTLKLSKYTNDERIKAEEEMCDKLEKEVSRIWHIPRNKIEYILDERIYDVISDFMSTNNKAEEEYIYALRFEKRALEHLIKLYKRGYSRYQQLEDIDAEIPLTRLCEVGNLALEILLESKNLSKGKKENIRFEINKNESQIRYKNTHNNSIPEYSESISVKSILNENSAGLKPILSLNSFQLKEFIRRTALNEDVVREIREELCAREFMGKKIIKDIKLDVRSMPTETLIILFPRKEKLPVIINSCYTTMDISNTHLLLAEAEKQLLLKKQGKEETGEETLMVNQLRIIQNNERKQQFERRATLLSEGSYYRQIQHKQDEHLAKEIVEEIQRRNERWMTKEKIRDVKKLACENPNETDSDKLMNEILMLRSLYTSDINSKFEKPDTRLERKRMSKELRTEQQNNGQTVIELPDEIVSKEERKRNRKRSKQLAKKAKKRQEMENDPGVVGNTSKDIYDESVIMEETKCEEGHINNENTVHSKVQGKQGENFPIPINAEIEERISKDVEAIDRRRLKAKCSGRLKATHPNKEPIPPDVEDYIEPVNGIQEEDEELTTIQLEAYDHLVLKTYRDELDIWRQVTSIQYDARRQQFYSIACAIDTTKHLANCPRVFKPIEEIDLEKRVIEGEGGTIEMIDMINGSNTEIDNMKLPVTLKEWLSEQNKDEDLRVLLNTIEDGKAINIKRNLESRARMEYGNQDDLRTNDKDNFDIVYRCKFIEDGEEITGPLVRRSNTSKEFQHEGMTIKRWMELEQLLVPDHLIKKLLRVGHDKMGHQGSKRTLSNLKKKYYWVTMRGDVQKHVRGCHYCNCRKADNRVPNIPIQKYETMDRPFQQVHADLTGPFPKTANGNTQLLVLRDRLTKFIYLVPLSGKKAETVRPEMSKVFQLFGYPNKLVTDRGKEFTLNNMKALLKERRTDAQAKAITPQAPRVNGEAENAMRYIKDILVAYINKFHNNWDQNLSEVQSFLNSFTSDATGYSPNFLMFARELPQADETYMSSLSPKELNSFPKHLKETMEYLWEEVAIKLSTNVDRFNVVPKKPLKFIPYNPGEFIYIKRIPRKFYKSKKAEERYVSARKLQFRYSGPFQVLERKSIVAYSVDMHGKRRTVHAINMKKA